MPDTEIDIKKRINNTVGNEISTWIQGWIPRRMAQTIWPFDPIVVFNNEEHQSFWDQFLEDSDLRSELYENEHHLSQFGRRALVVSFDDDKNPLVHQAQLISINFEKGRKVFSAKIVKRVNTAGTHPAFIVEFHTQQKVTRSFFSDENAMKKDNEISSKIFNTLTGFNTKGLWEHNIGWNLVIPFFNLAKMSIGRRQDDLFGTDLFLIELDALHERKLKELNNAGTKFYYNGQGVAAAKDSKKNREDELKKDYIDIALFAENVGIGESGVLPIVVQQANYVNTLAPISQDWDRVMGRFMNSIGDTEPEFESTGVVQQNNLERVQQESSKILSVSSKIKERQKSISYMIQVIGHHTDKLPTDIKEFVVEIKPANVPTADEMEAAMPDPTKDKADVNTEHVDKDPEVK